MTRAEFRRWMSETEEHRAVTEALLDATLAKLAKEHIEGRVGNTPIASERNASVGSV